MKTAKESIPLKPVILIVSLVGLVLLAVVLAFYLQDWVRAHILVPLYFFFWVLGQYFKGTPQVAYWGALVVFTSAAVLKSVSSRVVPGPIVGRGGHTAPRRDRLSFWLLQIYRCVMGDFSRQQFNHSLSTLLLETLAHREHMQVKELEASLDAGTFIVPEKIRAFLERRQMDRAQPMPKFWNRLFYSLRELVLNFSSNPDRRREIFLDIYLKQEVDEVLKFLEQQVEIRDGNKN